MASKIGTLKILNSEIVYNETVELSKGGKTGIIHDFSKKIAKKEFIADVPQKWESEVLCKGLSKKKKKASKVKEVRMKRICMIF